jgi:hypothetical protein
LSAYNGAVDTPQLCIYGDLSLQFLKDSVQSAIAIPLVKQTPGGLPLSELLGQISPRGASAQNPEDAIEDDAPVERWTTTWFTIWNHWSDALPLIIVHA